MLDGQGAHYKYLVSFGSKYDDRFCSDVKVTQVSRTDGRTDTNLWSGNLVSKEPRRYKRYVPIGEDICKWTRLCRAMLRRSEATPGWANSWPAGQRHVHWVTSKTPSNLFCVMCTKFCTKFDETKKTSQQILLHIKFAFLLSATINHRQRCDIVISNR